MIFPPAMSANSECRHSHAMATRLVGQYIHSPALVGSGNRGILI